jgi:hypothetical protein
MLALVTPRKPPADITTPDATGRTVLARLWAEAEQAAVPEPPPPPRPAEEKPAPTVRFNQD